MNRRQFFQALSGGVVAGAVAPFLPISAPPLQFHRDALKMLRLGDTFTIEGRYAVNPEARLDVIEGVGWFRDQRVEAEIVQ